MQRSIPDKQGNENIFFLSIFAFGLVLLSSCLSFIMIFQFFTFSVVAIEMKNKIETVLPQPTPFGVFLIFSIFGEWISIMSIYGCCEKKQNGGNRWWLFDLSGKISYQIERTVHGETIFRCTKAGKSTGDVSMPQNQEIGIRFEAGIIGCAFAGKITE